MVDPRSELSGTDIPKHYDNDNKVRTFLGSLQSYHFPPDVSGRNHNLG